MDPSDRRYHPGLDGIRALAVGLVLVFHSGLGWVDGGFLGVSVFFTLSGFLITSLLLAEIGDERHAGRVALGRFWGRRLRRLAPASLACLAAITLLGPSLGDATTRAELPGDVLAALGYVANWRFVFAEQSYAELFSNPSPVLHFWSLAIEEQYYMLFPLLVAGLAVLGLRRRGIGLVLGLLAAGSTVLAIVLSRPDRVYYGTDTRAAELLIGGLLACTAASWLARAEPDRRSTRAVSYVGMVGLVAVSAAAVLTSGTRGWVTSGGLSLFALASVALVAGAIVPGPTSRLLSLPPLPAIGRISYGLYLYHWPIFLWLTEERTGLYGFARFALALAVTVAVSVVSYHLLERPVRERRLLGRPGPAVLAFGVGALGVVAVVAALPDAPAPAAESPTPVLLTPATAAPTASPIASTTPPSTSPPTTQTTLTAPTTTAPARRPVVLVLGSDGALAGVLGSLGSTTIDVVDRSDPTCPVFEAAAVDDGAARDVACAGFRRLWVDQMAASTPDAVVVGIGAAERVPYRLATDDEWRQVGTDRDSLRLEEMVTAIGLLDAFAAPGFVHDAGPVDDIVASAVALALDAHRGLGRLDLTAADPLAQVVDAAVAHRDGTLVTANVPRLLVVGDSTARNVAEGLAGAAEGRLEVVSAGAEGCPLVRTTGVEALPGEQRPTDYCPTHASWADTIEAFQPDAVLAVAGPAEQWVQHYPDIEGWHAPGSPGWVDWHDRELAAIHEVLATRGLPMLLLDAPALRDVRDRLGDEPEHVAAWNAQIDRWDSAWVSVVEVPYAMWFSDPDSDLGRSERPDGVHASPDVKVRIAGEHLVPRLLAALDAMRVEMIASGCLVAATDGSESLDVEACRARG